MLGAFSFRRNELAFDHARIMGVVNVTPDSFSDGGQFADPARAIAHGFALLEAGADLVDVGGESTRPGAQPVPVALERERVLPVVRALADRGIVSVDTTKPEVAEAALEAGAEIINDISGGLYHPEILRVVARRKAAIVLGHVRGRPAEMQSHARYADVVREVRDELAARVEAARGAGIERVLVDPGLGFAKTAEHNLALLAHLRELSSLGCPIVVGASRKSFLGKLTGRPEGEREVATAAADVVAILNGASIVRVHDVEHQRDAVRVADAVKRQAS